MIQGASIVSSVPGLLENSSSIIESWNSKKDVRVRDINVDQHFLGKIGISNWPD